MLKRKTGVINEFSISSHHDFLRLGASTAAHRILFTQQCGHLSITCEFGSVHKFAECRAVNKP